MSHERLHKSDGTTLIDWIIQTTAELPVDAVGLWQIIPEARTEFGLEGDELIDCVERTISALLDCGAKPVRGGVGTDHDWIEQFQYGTHKDEIVEKIINEWFGWGLGNPTAGGLWFALPELFG
ncbi:hypothetical protein ACELLULO517_00420 [Acidisoma cellulosilytica]|uniref:Uncharacterized protein n=1 Tax=Acidisoma cellulosilyticum TaxID=2802395 RepID=A0A963YYV5_9PROT|nr:hypothetical protein [Acidisoma cellulosilyticum]MCB8878678.1 hypothetical protein [Acidisoma cellulosilyticum]